MLFAMRSHWLMHLLWNLLLWQLGIRKSMSGVAPGRGEFNMNGIFPITASGEVYHQSGVMMAEAMRYAVRVVNNQTHRLHGYNLRIHEIFDSFGDTMVSQNIKVTFMDQVPFLIGPYSSETSYIGSILTSTFKQIAFSYSATYSDFDAHAQNYMARTVPSDKFRLQALLELIRTLKWNYIGIVSSYGYNGEREALQLATHLAGIGVCVASQVDLARHEDGEGYEKAIEKMDMERKLKAVVMFTTVQDSKELLIAIKKLKLKDRFFILCVYGCSNYIEVVNGVEDVAEGILSLDVHNPEIEGFRDYFLNLTPSIDSPPYFLDFWEDVFKCSLTGELRGMQHELYRRCNGTERLTKGRGYYANTPVKAVINAVYAIANIIQNMIEDVCSEEKMTKMNRSDCMINTERDTDRMNRYLLKKIPRYEDGSVRYSAFSNNTSPTNIIRYDIHCYTAQGNLLVGSWEVGRDTDELQLHAPSFYFNQNTTDRQAFCSQPCVLGHVRVRDTNITKRQCCWTCRPCPGNNIVVNDTCVQCKATEKADDLLTSCTPLPRKFLALNRKEAWVILFVCIIGLCSVCSITMLFVRYNDSHIVRSSGRDLCYLILFGVLLLFIVPFTFLTKPNVYTCLFRGALPGVAFMCCYVPLFLRTNRIFRIFESAKISVAKPPLVSAQSQLLVSFAIIGVQFLLVVVWFASKMPEPEETVALAGTHVNVHCKAGDNPIILVLNLSLSVVFMILCTVLAFKTRRFPKNYNEAKFIGITLYLSCVAWAVFFPGYFLTTSRTGFLREILMCSICLALGYITLFGLFTQKVRMLICGVPNGKQQFDANSPAWNLSEDSSDRYLHVKRNSLKRNHQCQPASDVLLLSAK